MGAYSDRVIADGATHYWRLGEPSGTTAADSIVSGGTAGTIAGGVTLNQPGPLADGSKAMTFDGTTGKIQLAGTLAFPVPVTLEGWGKVPTGANPPCPVVSNEVGGAADNPLWFGIGNDVLRLNLYGISDNDGVTTVNDAQWHHLAAVSDGATALLYLDGVLNATRTMARATPSSHPGWIGWNQADPSRFWRGGLAEVAVYPTALSAPTLAAHYALRTATGGGARRISFGMWRQVLP